MGKGEIACYEQFLLFPQCFRKACFPGRQKVSLFGNGLSESLCRQQINCFFKISSSIVHLKTFWEKEKIFVACNYSFSNNLFKGIHLIFFSNCLKAVSETLLSQCHFVVCECVHTCLPSSVPYLPGLELYIFYPNTPHPRIERLGVNILPRLFVHKNFNIGQKLRMVSHRVFLIHMCIPWVKNFSVLPRSRSSVKVSQISRSHFHKMTVAGALVFHKHVLYTETK